MCTEILCGNWRRRSSFSLLAFGRRGQFSQSPTAVLEVFGPLKRVWPGGIVLSTELSVIRGMRGINQKRNH